MRGGGGEYFLLLLGGTCEKKTSESSPGLSRRRLYARCCWLCLGPHRNCVYIRVRKVLSSLPHAGGRLLSFKLRQKIVRTEEYHQRFGPWGLLLICTEIFFHD